MYDNIKASIMGFYPLTDETFDLLTDSFTEHIFAPRTEIITAGKFDDKVYFIEQGLTRSYCILKGKDVTTWFSKEGDITFGLLDLYRKTAGFEYVETVERCITYSIPIDRINYLCATRIDFANFWLHIHQECLLAVQQHRIDRLAMSAKERYLKWIDQYEAVHNRLNLGHVASFLGMELPSLSKIRSEIK